jgi:hypothetical protein
MVADNIKDIRAMSELLKPDRFGIISEFLSKTACEVMTKLSP